MKMVSRPIVAGFLAAAALPFAAPASSQELPKTLAVTAYDVGASGYAQAVAIGAALKNKYGVSLRVLPGKNDVSRTVPLREKKVEFSFNGIGTYFSQEAVDIFGSRDWGPQEVRMELSVISDNCLTQFFAGDAGIKSLSELKGKRVAWVKGSPALNHNTYAHLRFGGLTWDDVQKVEVGGNNAAFEAVLNDQADSFFSTTSSGNMIKMQNSPRGLVYPAMPHSDTAAWARLQEVAPYFLKHKCTEAAGNPPPWEAATYPYPIVMNYVWGDADLSYALTKAIFATFDEYKSSAPASSGYSLERQKLDWVVPFHDGAIRFYKEAGKWTPELQAHNDKLIERQKVLKQLWKDFTATNPPDDDRFTAAWMKFRFDGMKKAGHNPIWETF